MILFEVGVHSRVFLEVVEIILQLENVIFLGFYLLVADVYFLPEVLLLDLKALLEPI